MKKILPLLMLASTCLASCGENSVYGKYEFLMGRQGEGETRVSIEMELKDEVSQVKEDFKNFYANIEMGGLAGNTGSSENSIDVFEVAAELLEALGVSGVNVSKGKIQVPGYYKVSDLSDPKYGNKVKIAFDLGETLNSLFSVFGLEPTDIVSHFIVSYCNKSSFTLQLPVSLDDIQMQLAWYGIYLDYDPYLKDKVNGIGDLITLILEGKMSPDTIKHFTLTNYLDHKLPGEQDSEIRYGSHPKFESDEKGNITANEVLEMNEKYQGLFSNTFVYSVDSEGKAGEIIGSVFQEITETDNYYFFPYDSAFNNFNTPTDVILKKDVGVLDYDFSEETLCVLNVTSNTYEDGSHPFTIQYKDPSITEWNWKDFYKKPFEFRDYHDIKIELKKE